LIGIEEVVAAADVHVDSGTGDAPKPATSEGRVGSGCGASQLGPCPVEHGVEHVGGDREVV
jgi:hypothetical protein